MVGNVVKCYSQTFGRKEFVCGFQYPIAIFFGVSAQMAKTTVWCIPG
jgi:hypothetical protein